MPLKLFPFSRLLENMTIRWRNGEKARKYVIKPITYYNPIFEIQLKSISNFPHFSDLVNYLKKYYVTFTLKVKEHSCYTKQFIARLLHIPTIYRGKHQNLFSILSSKQQTYEQQTYLYARQFFSPKSMLLWVNIEPPTLGLKHENVKIYF